MIMNSSAVAANIGQYGDAGVDERVGEARHIDQGRWPREASVKLRQIRRDAGLKGIEPSAVTCVQRGAIAKAISYLA
jgi:hypothetical protein